MFHNNKSVFKENFARKESKYQQKVQNKQAKLQSKLFYELAKKSEEVIHCNEDFKVLQQPTSGSCIFAWDNVQFKITKFNHFFIATLLLSFVDSVTAQAVAEQNSFAHLDEAYPSAPTIYDYLASSTDYKTLDKSVIFADKIICQSKTNGRTPGKRCLIDGQDYLLKEAVSKDDNGKLTQVIPYNPYYAIFSKKLIENMSKDIRQPELTLFYEIQPEKRGIYFLGSKIIDDVELAKTFLSVEPSMKRQALIAAIGLKNSHYLFVIGSFIPDVLQVDNWGRDSKGNLVILDADDYQRTTFENYYKCAIRAARFFDNEEIFLSLADISAIKEIYLTMRQASTPNVHHTINLTDDAYQVLLDTYINACDKTLGEYGSEYSMTKLRSELATSWINNILSAFVFSDVPGLLRQDVATFKK